MEQFKPISILSTFFKVRKLETNLFEREQVLQIMLTHPEKPSRQGLSLQKQAGGCVIL